MMNQISWTAYFMVVAALLAVYYFVIIWVFYREDIRQFFKKQSMQPTIP